MTPTLEIQKYSMYVHEIGGVQTVFRNITPKEVIAFFEKLNDSYRKMYLGRDFVHILDKMPEE